ncbi:MAG: hypothetical protein PHP00_08205 [Thiotrichaceae bacterium]|nr:hypothetical protein [Thiotrichaceae bacterium]
MLIYKAKDRGTIHEIALTVCYIDALKVNESLAPQASIIFQCGNINVQVSPADKFYVEMPEEELVLETTPKLIHFTEGKNLEFKD